MSARNEELSPEQLASLRARDVGFYLRRKGWTEEERTENASYWTNPNKQAVLVPLREFFKDYSARLAELFVTLQRVEKRSFAALLSDVRQAASDVLRVRISREDERDGTIPLSAAPRIFRGAADMLTYAAAAVVEPRPSYRSLPESVRELRNDARFGQTERGSYVVNIIAPLPTTYDLFSEAIGATRRDSEETAPLARKSMRLLMGALDTIKESTSGSFISDQVPLGISAQLCTAIQEASGGARGLRSLDISANWSQAFTEKATTPSNAALAPQQIEAISIAAKTLGEVKTKRNTELRGRVFRLSRDPAAPADEISDGIITIDAPTTPGGKSKHVSMAVTREHHKKAIEAYRGNLLVRCVGELLDRRNAPYLYSVSLFEILK